MQAALPLFFSLLLAHIAADFPLQTARMVDEKKRLVAGGFVRHGLAHLVCSVAALALFTNALLLGAATLLALFVLIVGHLMLDFAKSLLTRWRPTIDGAAIYVADQFLHLVVIAAAALIAAGTALPADALWAWWLARREVALVTATIVAATVFPAGYLIRFLLRPMSDQLAKSADEAIAHTESAQELANAGLYLGWLERALLVTAFAFGSLTAVGLIIGAKSVARFPAFKTRAFAEYFLLGTLLSVGIAALGGWVLRLALAWL